MMGKNVAHHLLSGKDPDRTALSFLQSTVSYGDLAAQAGRIAAYLLRCHARPGDRVLLVGDNSLFWVACYLGTLQTGLITVPIPANSSERNLSSILRMSGAKIVCAQASVATTHAGALSGTHLITDRIIPPIPQVLSQLDFASLPSPQFPVSDYATVNHDKLAALFFTSGSTGQPRGVMITHANIIANTESIISCLSLSEDDRMMAVLPFHYCYGASLLHTHLSVGGEVVVDNRFMYPETVLQRMIDTQCTGFAGTPSHFQILLRKSSFKRKQFPSLRHVQQAGGHLAPIFVRELKETLPDKKIYIMYGQTEATARLSYLPPEMLEAKLGSIGKGMPGVTLRVVDKQGRDVRPGEIGEIVAEGPNVAKGYWQERKETMDVFRNGSLYTGDLAQVDEDRFIYIVDRAKDFVKCRGEKVSCRQIEEVLLECSEIVETAVVGIPDDVLGEALKVFAVPRNKHVDGFEERIASYCRTRLPLHQLPKQIVVLRSLPKNSAGKVMKSILKRHDTAPLLPTIHDHI
ncbi:MAG TPA: AMP-dependent synthetase [Nitrospira sp.]|nr:AMP-dependent synthetase [Nitrospira sp.]HBR50727.1 AMP-dependent synthetase [Nitrospira sp.]